MTDHSPTTTQIDAQHLTGVELAPDGSSFALHGVDQDGAGWSLDLPSASLQQLILTLPNLAVKAMRAQHNDDTLRIVYPACSTTVELASDARTFILTLWAEGGFHVSFGLSAEQCETVGDSPRVAESMMHRVARPS
ncbi:hypothetical protein [Paraburkholderia rhizosphaerae]|uniref:Uncharacterized protein n=1 Tax=Paraburkholderia rhizosphaerae TaxID=480658 RepID=A0A4R8LG74_9BURK|nr:hypothetical protein [Paraburkholderia rhizosphaerae]TDY42113.1 hypothetical protein BX592_123103 [Paraburkholderia rhizosphaerae]